MFGQYSWGLLSYYLVKGDRHELDRRHELYGAPLLAHEISIKGSYIDFDLEHRMAGTRIGPDKDGRDRHRNRKERSTNCETRVRQLQIQLHLDT